MTRVLVLVALALLVAYLLSEGLGRLRGRLDELLRSASNTPGQVPRGRSGGELVSCTACGVHVLRERALAAHPSRGAPAHRTSGTARFYCSETCRSRAESAA